MKIKLEPTDSDKYFFKEYVRVNNPLYFEEQIEEETKKLLDFYYNMFEIRAKE